jgi:hypothetical protein
MNFKIGDNVIITKRISEIYNVKGVVAHIGKNSNCITYFYRVKHNYGKDGFSNNTCNIFINHTGEFIESDIQQDRQDKLDKLGI